MGTAFLVLGAFYCPAVRELAAVAKAAAYIVFPAMGVANPLYRRGGIAALQPKFGRRRCRRG